MQPSLATLQRTDEEGIPTPTGRYGPYLMNAPTNAFNGASAVEVVDGPIQAGYRPERANIGWIFVKSTGRLYPTDRNGAVMKLD